jgi:phosphopantetheinyl transferase (holo-ACP synthase)
MSKPMIRIHDLETNEIIDREMTDDEIAQLEKDQKDFVSKIAAENEKKAEKEALLKQLGISAEQAKLLLN